MGDDGKTLFCDVHTIDPDHAFSLKYDPDLIFLGMRSQTIQFS